MTNAGTFNEWMTDTHALIELIQTLGKGKWDLREFTSPYFSFSHNKEIDSWTYKYSRVLTAQEEIKSVSIPATSGLQSISGPIGSSIGAPGGYYTTGFSNSTVTTPGINHVIITTNHSSQIKSVQWIRKPNSGLSIVNSMDSDFGNQHGGKVRLTMLFLPNNKILINDTVYSPDSPDAFTKDLSDDDASIRYLDLLNFREQYETRLFE